MFFSLWNPPPFWHKIMESRWLMEVLDVLNMLCYILTERNIWVWIVWIWSPLILISAVSKFESAHNDHESISQTAHSWQTHLDWLGCHSSATPHTIFIWLKKRQKKIWKAHLNLICDYRFTVCWMTLRLSFVLIRNFFWFCTYKKRKLSRAHTVWFF